ncbi:type II secretion system F family protein [Variovorax sp. VRV01]|uniref:type II secretion system F family protein n=1 Tax=Variovorax sp. VRV01 TaxID=2769259 RepID=UPI00177AB463|nr:type II secretion system F family protein [Variovorax sp. VRV01]MBD9662529.1 type II secretion system F family protein [Variovorax sp. VRV01]
MAKVLLTVACVALLLAAAGLLLWQWAKGRQARQAATRHLDQQILASTAAAVQTPMPLRDLPSDALMTDPWLETDASATASEPAGLLERAMPEWLIGVIEPRMAALGLVAIVMLAALAGLFGGSIAALSALTLLALLAVFAIWLRLQKFRRKLVSQLPGYIDAMVRLITIGNSTQAAFQLAIATTEAPLRGQLERAASLVRAGIDLDRALHQTASSVRIDEMFLLASILGLGVRYGGRSDLLLERVGNFMRDREQAEHELVAMSSETRLSAWVLGLLPVGVGAFLIMTNPGYFVGMWNDGTGRMLIFSSAGLQLVGAALLYRLARLS